MNHQSETRTSEIAPKADLTGGAKTSQIDPKRKRSLPAAGCPPSPLIREQAFGEALDPDKLERLASYEVHLDRKLEGTLALRFRLKELRPAAVER